MSDPARPAQASIGTPVVAGLLLLALLSGCGKRPPVVDPPDGVDKHSFPKTYPDLSTDPAATLPPPSKP